MSDLSRPVFVVGCSRGGTTLLQSILTNHPELTGFPETNILYGALDDLEARRYGAFVLGRAKTLQAKLRALPNHLGYTTQPVGWRFERFLNDIDRPDLKPLSPGNSRSLKTIFQAFRTLLDVLAEGGTWVEKTPENIFCLDHLQRYFPDAAFIHIVREGPATIASIMEAAQRHQSFHSRFGGRGGLRKAIGYWNNTVLISHRARARANHAVVRFEDLVAAPKLALSDVEALLGLTFTEAMLKYDTSGIALSQEVWKDRGSSQIVQPESKFDTLFDAEQKRLIAEHIVSLEALVPREVAVQSEH